MAILFNLHDDMNMLHRQFSRAKRREESGYVYFCGLVGLVTDAECFFSAFLKAYMENRSGWQSIPGHLAPYARA
ncbi:hypothetical protein J21TS3_18100 [Paenibacillus cookii]|jgi:hypothetical protein|uniref:Uncharacterized protein n=1 Tax=Paenibacillus cookii TaxID=157839 RepID=A0ABQ4LUR7_9BACL|nr:hypothetical protein CM49_01578 [Paenibacillus sp. P1XP2]GIO66989.1 hypothetical protein J21TS3_18100 [Paenibacillus cookii]